MKFSNKLTLTAIALMSAGTTDARIGQRNLEQEETTAQPSQSPTTHTSQVPTIIQENGDENTTSELSTSSSYHCEYEGCNEGVWNTPVSDDDGSYSCGSRITWLQSNAGGNHNKLEACQKVTNDFPNSCTCSVIPAPTPSPTSSLCKDGEIPMNSEPSIWSHRNDHPSCGGDYSKTQVFSQCKGDETSISLDMNKINDKQGCFLYDTTAKKSWDMQIGTTITFDAEWEDCGNVWTAPLWTLPTNWKTPQWSSGEIDLLETCAGHKHKDSFTTSIICNEHNPHSDDCVDKEWGNAALKGGGHFKGKIDDNGTWTMYKCELGSNNNCDLISRYPSFLYENTGTQEHQKFHFASDLYNGGRSGDGQDQGWNACGHLNPDTKCKYTIANIRVNNK